MDDEASVTCGRDFPSRLRRLSIAIIMMAAGLRAAPVDESRITNASNARLRSAPSATATVVEELPLGTELVVLGQAGQGEPWYHVRIDAGRDGWLLGRLTIPFDRERPLLTVEALLTARLESASASDLRGTSFSTHLQVFDLIERYAARTTDREAQGRFALYRLRAMSHVLRSVPFNRGEIDPYRRWIHAHTDAARYNEPGGQWMVDPEYVLKIHGDYSDVAAADDIAWFFVENGEYGECEGDVPCYADGANTMGGGYLRLHADGKHTDDANARIAESLNAAMDNLLQYPRVLAEFDPRTRCGELRSAVDPLIAAIAASRSTQKAAALKAVDRYAQLCK